MRIAVRAGLIALAARIAVGQTPAPAFEVASVRALGPQRILPNPYGVMTGGPGSNDPGRIQYSAMPLKRVIMLAYGILSDGLFSASKFVTDLVSGPAWLSTETYDIVANIQPGTTRNEVSLMLQNLLVERFKLAVHRETLEVSGYELVIAKGGSKLRQSTDLDPISGFALLPRGPMDEDGFPVVPPGYIAMKEEIRDGRRYLAATNVTLADLIDDTDLHDVVDKTGLTGRFNYHLETRKTEFIGGPPGLQTAFGEAEGPGFPEALEKQLGLKLEKKKVSVEVLVIDYVERVPTEN